MKLNALSQFNWRILLVAVSLLIAQKEVNAGVSDHLAREMKTKYFEGNSVSTLSQYSDLTYLVELIALGLVAAALLAVTVSIMTRLRSGNREQKRMLSLRRSAENDKKVMDETLVEIDILGNQIRDDASETNEYLNRAAAKVHEAEQHAETVANIEIDMKQLVDGTTERMSHIQEYWEQLLTETKESMNQVNANLEKGLDKTDVQANIVDQKGRSVNSEIKKTLDLTLLESKELLTQIKDYQQQAKIAFASFTNTLGNFESQAHEQFDDIFNTADIARQELNANLDESREYMKSFRNKSEKNDIAIKGKLILKGIDTKKNVKIVKEEKASDDNNKAIARKGRPIIGVNDAESLTDPSLVSADYNSNYASKDGDANLVSLFTKFKHHSS